MKHISTSSRAAANDPTTFSNPRRTRDGRI